MQVTDPSIARGQLRSPQNIAYNIYKTNPPNIIPKNEEMKGKINNINIDNRRIKRV